MSHIGKPWDPAYKVVAPASLHPACPISPRRSGHAALRYRVHASVLPVLALCCLSNCTDCQTSWTPRPPKPKAPNQIHPSWLHPSQLLSSDCCLQKMPFRITVEEYVKLHLGNLSHQSWSGIPSWCMIPAELGTVSTIRYTVDTVRTVCDYVDMCKDKYNARMFTKLQTHTVRKDTDARQQIVIKHKMHCLGSSTRCQSCCHLRCL